MVIIKTPEQVEGIRKSCQILSRILKEVAASVRPGMTTFQINERTEQLIAASGATPAFKGYRPIPGIMPFPSVICTSINDVVVHGPATSHDPLKEGDIIGLDLGVKLNGFFSDMAVTVAVGEIAPKTRALMEATEAALHAGIAQIKPGNRIRDISTAIEKSIRAAGKYGIVRDFVGHGVGLAVHEEPQIPNRVDRHLRTDLDIVLKEGMVLALEPMVTLGTDQVSILDDGWTVATDDGSLAAHFEHTIAVTKDGHEVLTA